jgi:hypothetical protein
MLQAERFVQEIPVVRDCQRRYRQHHMADDLTSAPFQSSQSCSLARLRISASTLRPSCVPYQKARACRPIRLQAADSHRETINSGCGMPLHCRPVGGTEVPSDEMLMFHERCRGVDGRRGRQRIQVAIHGRPCARLGKS